MIAWLKCRVFGHRRGKFHSLVRDASNNVKARMFICPRCSETWTRKVKAS